MTNVTSSEEPARGPAAPQPGPLGRLAGLAFRRRGLVLLAWLLALGLAIGLSSAFGEETSYGASLPDSDSTTAQSLLADRFRAQSGSRVDVVVRADEVTGDDVQGRVDDLLGEIGGLPHVTEVSG